MVAYRSILWFPVGSQQEIPEAGQSFPPPALAASQLGFIIFGDPQGHDDRFPACGGLPGPTEGFRDNGRRSTNSALRERVGWFSVDRRPSLRFELR